MNDGASIKMFDDDRSHAERKQGPKDNKGKPSKAKEHSSMNDELSSASGRNGRHDLPRRDKRR